MRAKKRRFWSDISKDWGKIIAKQKIRECLEIFQHTTLRDVCFSIPSETNKRKQNGAKIKQKHSKKIMQKKTEKYSKMRQNRRRTAAKRRGLRGLCAALWAFIFFLTLRLLGRKSRLLGRLLFLFFIYCIFFCFSYRAFWGASVAFWGDIYFYSLRHFIMRLLGRIIGVFFRMKRQKMSLPWCKKWKEP